jgi:predicted SAM-dependent methyltransferase
VLEHIAHIDEFQKEIQRVLKPGGCAIHIMPSGNWRFWTNITVLLRAWRPARVHGEQAGNILSDIYYFSRRWWTQLFRETGRSIEGSYSNGLFYTGSSIMGSRLSLGTRAKLSRVLGSSCNVFVLRQTDDVINTQAS